MRPFDRPADTRTRALSPEQAAGTQALSRALGLLFRIATDGHEGMALKELARQSALDSATARRLLLCLSRHGFVEQDPHSRRYFLGLDFFNLAAAASNRFDLSATVRGALARLSRHTGETAAFFARSGTELICTDIIRTAGYGGIDPVDMGSRRAIGAGAFGMALLAALDDDEAESITIRNLRLMSRFPEDDARRIGAAIRQTRQQGYAFEYDAPGGTVTLAVALMNRQGRPDRVIGLCSAGSLRTLQLDQIARLLIGEARHIEDALWRMPGPIGAPGAPHDAGLSPTPAVSYCEMTEAV